jgi:hypothetical protein
MKILAVAFLACMACVATGRAQEMIDPDAGAALIRVDWQEPQMLPPRFRNHCANDAFSGRPYCSNHCGVGYQFYFCSRRSFGCCRIGLGYCDGGGLLRCHP